MVSTPYQFPVCYATKSGQTQGPPGVGKTLTAESIAMRANKPLFAVGVADIGLDPEKVQVNLERLFDLGRVWEAVLLM